MRRSVGPWFRKGKNCWFVCHEGRQVNLKVKGEGNAKEAVKAWHRLMAGDDPVRPEPIPCPESVPSPEPKQGPAPKGATVRQVVDAFLADAEGRMTPGCLRNYNVFLKPFAKRFGPRPAEGLTVGEAEAYARKPEWSMTYRANFLASLVSAYRWAERGGLVGRNPLANVRKPARASRGAKALVSAEDHARLCEHADPVFRAFLRLLWLTGARPGEIASLSAEDIDAEHGLAVLSQHKTAHLGKARVLLLSPEALAVIQGIGRAEGLLFPGEGGGVMSCQAIGRRMARLCERAGVKPCMAYGYRHSFATDALANGVPDAHVSALLGHSGTAMLHKHYSHLTAKTQALRNALNQVR